MKLFYTESLVVDAVQIVVAFVQDGVTSSLFWVKALSWRHQSQIAWLVIPRFFVGKGQHVTS